MSEIINLFKLTLQQSSKYLIILFRMMLSMSVFSRLLRTIAGTSDEFGYAVVEVMVLFMSLASRILHNISCNHWLLHDLVHFSVHARSGVAILISFLGIVMLLSNLLNNYKIFNFFAFESSSNIYRLYIVILEWDYKSIYLMRKI